MCVSGVCVCVCACPRAPRRLDVIFGFAHAALPLIVRLFAFVAKSPSREKSSSNAVPSSRRAEPNFTVLSGDFAEINSDLLRITILTE